MEKTEQTEKRSPSGAAATLYEWIEAAVVSLVCVALVYCFLFRVVGVDGESMQMTLMDQDRLLLTSGYEQVTRGDIVVISRELKPDIPAADGGETEQAAVSAGSGGRTVMLEPLIKRVIAVGGDTLSIEDGQVYLNGELLSEPYLNQTTPAFELSGTVTVPEGHVFVMGDNRWDSHDSRWNDIGFVEVGDIVGKVFWRIWPLSSFGAV